MVYSTEHGKFEVLSAKEDGFAELSQRFFILSTEEYINFEANVDPVV